MKTICPTTFGKALLAGILIINVANPLLAGNTVSENIEIKVRLGICGNGVVEGEEECDGQNLDGKTCRGLGYGEGGLKCSSACEIIDSDCRNSLNNYFEETPKVSPIATDKPIPIKVSMGKQALPAFFEIYDVDQSGKIETKEVGSVFGKWVQDWRQLSAEAESRCDLNSDRQCDIYDFSILLYYVER